MVQNKGFGTAKNLTIESAQPKIVDNEKGLAIHFEITGSQLNGVERNLGITDIDFGNLEGQSVKTGQWWFTAGLLGHFTSYQSNIRHLDSYGRPDLSLVDSVEIHELTRFITAYGNADDGILDFLVNDKPDARDYPDAIYFSNATKTSVALADTAYVNGNVQPDNLSISLAVQVSRAGWNYARLNDPGRSAYQLTRILREDGEEIPLTNVWQTHCTMPDSREPVYENKLHLVDTFSTAGWVNYMLSFEKQTTNIPGIDSLAGVWLYPNPAHDELIIECEKQVIESVKIYDLFGRVVMTQQFSTFNLFPQSVGSHFSMNISALPPGVYFVAVYDDKKMIGNQKLIKQ
jgi:hypothetical protein